MHCWPTRSDRVSGGGGDGREAPDETVVGDCGDGAADRVKQNGDGVCRLLALLVEVFEAGLGGVRGQVRVIEGDGRQVFLEIIFTITIKGSMHCCGGKPVVSCTCLHLGPAED